MKFTLVLTITLLLLATSLAAFADAYTYGFVYDYGGHMGFQGYPGDSRGYDNSIQDTIVTWDPTPYGGMMFHKQRGVDGWNADDCFLGNEARGPLQSGDTEVFNDLYLWAGLNATPQPQGFQLHLIAADLSSPQITYTLRLVQIPVGITYTGPMQWGVTGETITLPFFATNDYTKGYKFQATITAPVPEPSSILALMGGLAGFGGLVLRRRKA